MSYSLLSRRRGYSGCGTMSYRMGRGGIRNRTMSLIVLTTLTPRWRCCSTAINTQSRLFLRWGQAVSLTRRGCVLEIFRRVLRIHYVVLQGGGLRFLVSRRVFRLFSRRKSRGLAKLLYYRSVRRSLRKGRLVI